METQAIQYDYIVVGSGFGGAVSALRLAEKGYKVLVIEKGRWWTDQDFPRTNWALRRWLWAPEIGCRGFFKMTFLRHITVLSGVGVGGGSLTYANTLPIPKKAFFESGNWQGLADWEQELQPFYELAYRMLGASVNPQLFAADESVRELARQIGREAHFEPTKVAVYFGEPGKTAPDPYFDGKGPDRTGCIHCGACMTGCKHNAKNTLDKNYLHLAQQLGVEIWAEKEVTDVKPLGAANGADGYVVSYKSTKPGLKQKGAITAKGIVFAGGVMGTVALLLRLKSSGSLPLLSDMVGRQIRSNNEALVMVVDPRGKTDYSEGIAIGSVLHTDADSHLEPTRYGRGSGFFRTLSVPLAFGPNMFVRLFKILFEWLRAPLANIRALMARDWAAQSTILLFMQHLDSTLQFKKGRIMPVRTALEQGPPPSAFVPRAGELTRLFSGIVKGKPFVAFTEVLLGIPSTAHILGGAVMGADASNGVIDKNNRVFNYQNMMVCDGAMISANPGVNPSLSITAIAERAMSTVPPK